MKLLKKLCNQNLSLKQYSMATGSLSIYYRDEVGNVNDNASRGKSFQYKTNITEKNRRKICTSWKGRRCKPITVRFKHRSYYSTQVS